MNRFAAIIDGISEWTGKVVSFLIIPILFIIVYNIFTRSAFNWTLVWPHELSCYLFGSMFMLGGAFALRYGNHVNVDMIVRHLSPRKRAILDIVTSTMLFLFCVVVVWKSGWMTLQALNLGFKYPSAWAPPIWPLKGAITVGAALVILQALAKLSRDVRTAIFGKLT